jgi:RNA polymerase sigma-70 factor, ECF subfamily
MTPATRCTTTHEDPAGPATAGEELLRSVYAEHADALLRYVVGYVAGDRQAAEDIVQETLLRAWRSAGTLDESQPSLRPWLFTVARRIVIDEHRKRLSRPREVDSCVLERIPEADQINQMLSSLAVTEAFTALSEQHREVLTEIYFRGSKVREAAETLGLPPGTVKSRTYYALRALKLALQERGVTTQ